MMRLRQSIGPLVTVVVRTLLGPAALALPCLVAAQTIGPITPGPGGTVVIPFTGVLESGTALGGAFVPVPGAGPGPLIIPASLPLQLFRSRSPDGSSVSGVAGYATRVLGSRCELVSNPFDDGTGNRLSDVLGMLPAGTVVSRWDGAGHSRTFTYAAGGVLPGAGGETLAPGDGTFVQVPAAAAPQTILFHGSVIGGDAALPPLPVQGCWNAVSPRRPETVTASGMLGRLPVDPAHIARWDPATETYESFIYFFGDWLSGEPLIGPTEAVMICESDGAAEPPSPKLRTPLPLPCGVAVATCHSGLDRFGRPQLAGYVVGVMDIRDPLGGGAIRGENWPVPAFHNELAPTPQVWNAANLGQVFGVTLDDAVPPNIYVAATAIYGGGPTATAGQPIAHNYGPGGPGAIYQLSGVDGSIRTFAVLTNHGPALGNLCFDPVHGQLLVSNFEDGLIQRIDRAGNLRGPAFDHGVSARPRVPGLKPLPDDGRPGTPTALGRRIWGLQVYDGRLYYAVWNVDYQHPSASLANEIWSVGLGADGSAVPATARREFALPRWVNVSPLVPGPGTVKPYSSPVSDLSFVEPGRMLLAERSAPYWAHLSRVLEYRREVATGSWLRSSNEFLLGDTLAPNSGAGGIDVACDGLVWATGDWLGRFTAPDGVTPAKVYGLAGLPPDGNNRSTLVTESYLVDLNGRLGTADKTQVGDVAVARGCCRCVALVDRGMDCPASGPRRWTFAVTNLTDGPIRHLVFLETPGFSLLDGSLVTLPLSLAPGQGTVVSVRLQLPPGAVPEFLCARITFHDGQFRECCQLQHCLATACRPPDLHIRMDPAQGVVILSWEGDAVLRTAETVTSPWVDLPGAKSPVVIQLREHERFFRLR